MKKFLTFYSILSCILFSTVFAIEPGINQPIVGSAAVMRYNPWPGYIGWFCYAIACFLIVYSIIKFIKMLKNKNPIWKYILFVLIMLVISYLLVALGSLIPLWFDANSSIV